MKILNYKDECFTMDKISNADITLPYIVDSH